MDPATQFAATPCNRWLGCRLLERSRERVVVELPVRLGASIAVCQCTIEQDGRLVASGTFTFLLRDRPSPSVSV